MMDSHSYSFVNVLIFYCFHLTISDEVLPWGGTRVHVPPDGGLFMFNFKLTSPINRLKLDQKELAL